MQSWAPGPSVLSAFRCHAPLVSRCHAPFVVQVVQVPCTFGRISSVLAADDASLCAAVQAASPAPGPGALAVISARGASMVPVGVCGYGLDFPARGSAGRAKLLLSRIPAARTAAIPAASQNCWQSLTVRTSVRWLGRSLTLPGLHPSVHAVPENLNAIGLRHSAERLSGSPRLCFAPKVHALARAWVGRWQGPLPAGCRHAAAIAGIQVPCTFGRISSVLAADDASLCAAVQAASPAPGPGAPAVIFARGASMVPVGVWGGT